MNRSKYSYRRFVAISLLLVIVFAGLAHADYSEGILTGSNTGAFTGNITVDGSIADWDVYWVSQSLAPQVNRANSDWESGLAGVSYWVEDGFSDNGQVGPGYGGQNYDHEAAYLGIGSTGLYGAIVTGSNPTQQYGFGDIFFDIDADNNWDLALAATDHNGLTAGGIYTPTDENAPWWTQATCYPDSSPAQAQADLVEELIGSNSEFIYSDTGLANGHNVLEFVIPWDILVASGIEYNGNMLMHFTQTCGNDLLELTCCNLIPETPDSPSPIPEPTTIALLGCGLAGLIARRRRSRA